MSEKLASIIKKVGGGGLTLAELTTELTKKTFTFSGSVTSIIVFPETGIYLVVIPNSLATVAAQINFEFIIRPTKVNNNSTTGFSKSPFYYAVVKSNAPNSQWQTNAFIGASGDTSEYILAKLMDI